MMKRAFQKGFTLVELLMVVAIMAAMATMATGGYFAITRGMEERAALSAGTEILAQAQQRARVDRTFTAVFFYNEYTTEGARGTAVAVRRSGRITRVEGTQYLHDEFGDLDRTYPVRDSGEPLENVAGMRLFRIPDRASVSGSGNELGYSFVYSAVEERDDSGDDFFFAKPTDGRMRSMAFVMKDANGISWKVGDAYGYEFASVTLGRNYIFGTGDIPTESQPLKMVGVKVFSPYHGASEDALSQTIDVSRCIDTVAKRIGSTATNKNKQ